MTDRQMQTHAVDRTSPKGQPFLGTCRLCGRTNMTIQDAMKPDCPNIRGLTEDEAIVEIISDG